MTVPQNILLNQNANVPIVTNSYKTEQRGAWSLDVIVLDSLGIDLIMTMEVSNDNENWKCYKIIKHIVNRFRGATFTGNNLPFDYIRFNISSGVTGSYKVVLNERS